MAEAGAGSGSAAQRPLSPHLQIHAMPINMVMSIVHRITGSALYVGTLLLAWWLVAAASGPAYFKFVNGIAASPLGLLVLFGFTWALLHHMLGGIRHFIWDTGRGFDIPTVDLLSWLTIGGSLTLTVLFWGAALLGRGML
jgi:succinate dehydrogenase / fumarate reductase cytochrome b subunit